MPAPGCASLARWNNPSDRTSGQPLRALLATSIPPSTRSPNWCIRSRARQLLHCLSAAKPLRFSGCDWKATPPYHARRFAHELTFQRPPVDIDHLSDFMFNATFDVNPHQSHAFLFAVPPEQGRPAGRRSRPREDHQDRPGSPRSKRPLLTSSGRSTSLGSEAGDLATAPLGMPGSLATLLTPAQAPQQARRSGIAFQPSL